MSEGWIKLHRSITDWEWFADAETLKLFLYLLLTANYEDRKWKDITIQRGQLVASLSGLASSLNMSVKKIRVRLNRLADSGTIITEWTNKYSVITICNYDSYQDGDDTEGQAKGQAKGRQDEPKRAGKKAGERAGRNDTLTDCEFDSCDQVDSDKGQAEGQAEGQAKGRQDEPKRAGKRAQTKEYKKNKEYISTSTARACEEEASEAESEEDEADESGEDARSEEPPQTNLQDDFSANNGEADKLTASARERAKNRLRIGDSESSYIGQGEVAAIRNWWNLEVANERVRKVNAVTGSRKTLLAQRVKEWTLYAYDNGIAQPTMSWQATLAKIAPIIRDSPYLQGKTPRAQPITFDRLISNDTFWIKILEGQYTDVAQTTSSTTSKTTTTTNGRNYTTAGETTRRTDLSDGRDYSVESLQRFLNR